ncbi:MAG: hypothetical protein ACK50G_00210 [bacterium]|jgi:hypothetical protein
MNLPRTAASAVLAVLAAALLSGCATMTGKPTQDVSIMTVDAHGRAVDGMHCRVVNGSNEYVGNSPMFGLQVRRSASDLEIECRKGRKVALGTAVSRGSLSGVAGMLLPGGTAVLAIDHLTGYRYAYPQFIKLQVGEHLVFVAGNEDGGRPTLGLQANAAR